MDEIKQQLKKELLFLSHQYLTEMQRICLPYQTKLSDNELIIISDDVIQEIAKISAEARKEELNELEKFEAK